mgnify:CR=1 FL=1
MTTKFAYITPASQKNKTNKRLRKNEAENDEDENEKEAEILSIKDRVYFHSDVSRKSILKLIQEMEKATEYAIAHSYDHADATIYLYIHSNGGDVFAGLSGMNHIQNHRIWVVTIADGYAASAATLLLLGGHERKAMQNAKILIHQLSTSFLGKFSDLHDEYENSSELMKTFEEIYTSCSKMTKKEFEKIVKKELHMDAKKALKYGIIDSQW